MVRKARWAITLPDSGSVLPNLSTRTGIPYRRGYLLHGPPGSGKTSFIQAIAASLGFDIYLVNLSLRGMADDKLALLLSQAPSRSIILMEDVDAAFHRRVQVGEDGSVYGRSTRSLLLMTVRTPLKLTLDTNHPLRSLDSLMPWTA